MITIGRKPLLSETGKRKLTEVLNDQTVALQGLTAGTNGGFEKAFANIVKSERNNTLADFNCHPVTIKKYKKLCGFKDELATRKTNGRVTAFNNIRNPISLCSMLATLERYVEKENYHSVDDVSVLINPMGSKLYVVTTELAKSILKDLNISLSTNGKVLKQRVVSFNCTISGDSRLTVTCIKFCDRAFEQYADKPLIIKLDKSLYIALYKYGMDEEIVNTAIYTEVIIPSTIKVRKYEMCC